MQLLCNNVREEKGWGGGFRQLLSFIFLRQNIDSAWGERECISAEGWALKVFRVEK